MVTLIFFLLIMKLPEEVQICLKLRVLYALVSTSLSQEQLLDKLGVWNVFR